MFSNEIQTRAKNILKELSTEFKNSQLETNKAFSILSHYIGGTENLLVCCLENIQNNSEFQHWQTNKAYTETLYKLLCYQSTEYEVHTTTLKLINNNFYHLNFNEQTNLLFFLRRNNLSFFDFLDYRLKFDETHYIFPSAKDFKNFSLKLLKYINNASYTLKTSAEPFKYYKSNQTTPIKDLDYHYSISEDDLNKVHDIFNSDYALSSFYRILLQIFKRNQKLSKKPDFDFLTQAITELQTISLATHNKIDLFDWLDVLNLDLEQISKTENHTKRIFQSTIYNFLKTNIENNNELAIFLDKFQEQFNKIQHNGKHNFFSDIFYSKNVSLDLFELFFSSKATRNQQNTTQDYEKALKQNIDNIFKLFEIESKSNHNIDNFLTVRIEQLKEALYLTNKDKKILEPFEIYIDNKFLTTHFNSPQNIRKIKL